MNKESGGEGEMMDTSMMMLNEGDVAAEADILPESVESRVSSSDGSPSCSSSNRNKRNGWNE